MISQPLKGLPLPLSPLTSPWGGLWLYSGDTTILPSHLVEALLLVQQAQKSLEAQVELAISSLPGGVQCSSDLARENRADELSSDSPSETLLTLPGAGLVTSLYRTTHAQAWSREKMALRSIVRLVNAARREAVRGVRVSEHQELLLCHYLINSFISSLSLW